MAIKILLFDFFFSKKVPNEKEIKTKLTVQQIEENAIFSENRFCLGEDDGKLCTMISEEWKICMQHHRSDIIFQSTIKLLIIYPVLTEKKLQNIVLFPCDYVDNKTFTIVHD